MPVNLGIWSCWKDVAGKWEWQDGIPSPKEKIRGYNRVNLCTGVGGQNTKQGRLSHRHNFWAGSTTEGHSLNVFQATLWFSETPLDSQLALFQMNSPTYCVEYILCKFISKSLANREGLQTFIQKLRFLHFGISPSKLHLMGSEMGLLASDVDLALGRVEMSCVQKIILTKVDAGQVATRQITNLHFCKVEEHDKDSLLWRFSLNKMCCKQQLQ